MGEERPPAIWFAEQRPRKPRLSKERIARAAVAVLDAEGASGLSMRRLAARLDVSAMSLYEYVSSKEDVLDLAVDEAFAGVELDGIDDVPWREALAQQLHRGREVMKRHPWLPALMSTRPLLGPNSLALAERFYAVLASVGLAGARLTAVIGALTYYVQGYVAMENFWTGVHRDPAREAELRAQAQQYLGQRREDYPVLAEQADLVGTDDFDESFELGLTTVLDGIEAQLRGSGDSS
ncbi:transcriptional regulator, TetR family [Saccharopolyspora kobensis]|uniref:Transcriptional regulator, TetR family n=1 Tax=Saccharopolyspora kobensis TaxID=146035 RepID=A0A1H6EIX2_9PSEU|nr:TetR/AcrR family transcriptional regulator [Saccharopolyspora kobensis]SEG97850.1 transcriptional regulator, TetR family [Saccharopolyspora kobensis]SFF24244.1 transcriptional regulator, TetR family [Saccharopolyspora kobensis]